jgi:hypothetical protein
MTKRTKIMLRSCGLITFLLPIVLIIVFFSRDSPSEIKLNCNIHYSPCTQTISGTKISLEIFPRPVKSMEDLTFQVKIPGYSGSVLPVLDLDMPGMEMGINQVHFKVLRQGVFSGKGIIVRCPTGKKLWRASITVPKMGTANFVFNVVY